MGYPHVAFETIHVLLAKYITYQAVPLSKIKSITVTGDYSCRILTSMLKKCKCIIQLVAYITFPNHPCYAAHGIPFIFRPAQDRS
jgi:hypothetical protein